jgi:cellulose synthase/poly-beta-1,6-N-acetylglucosamine synthase-like glycosyltransferase
VNSLIKFLHLKGTITTQTVIESKRAQLNTRLEELEWLLGVLSEDSCYQALAKMDDIELRQLTIKSIDQSILNPEHKTFYHQEGILPISDAGGIVTIATCKPIECVQNQIEEEWGNNAKKLKVIYFTEKNLLKILQACFSTLYLKHAVSALKIKYPDLSAFYTFSLWQKLAIICFFLIIIGDFFYEPLNFLVGLNIFFTVSLFFMLTYKVVLSIIGFKTDKLKKIKQEPLVDSKFYPIFTILLPLYGEKPSTLFNLFNHIQTLDYPIHRLDIKIVLEEDDVATLKNVKKTNILQHYEIILTPPSLPRTKAKACNYAFQFARGDYLTIFDAEDKPESDQLLKVLRKFNQSQNRNLACIQCYLNFYNSDENWLTRMFTLEYTYWFDLLLNGLYQTKAIIPLGGTSTYFRVPRLKKVLAWDPFNVTEDADLGVRLARLGYSTEVLASTTYEEANCKLSNWIPQRTRWIKGYMQTYLVHMRNPIKLFRQIGIKGMIGFQLFIGGTIITSLSFIFLLGFFILSFFLDFDHLYPHFLPIVAWINFFSGTILLSFLNIMAVLKRKLYGLLISAITAPFYWLMISYASYRALYQIIFKPSLWEKTEHGISKY